MIMKFLNTFLSVAFYTYATTTTTNASPTGASSCNTDGAVGSTHLTNAKMGSLETGAFEIFVGLAPLVTSTGNTVPLGESLDVSIAPTAGSTFRGALIRIAGTTVSTVTLLPGPTAQELALCDGMTAIGITHIDNTDKSEFGGTVTIIDAGDYIFDITVVVSNGGTLGSEYYYTQYTVTAADATTPAVPTTSPVAAGPVPTGAPVAAGTTPTGAPVADVPVPTDAPVADVPVPTDTPVDGVSMTDAPVYGEITDAPVAAPTNNNTGGMGQNETSAPGAAPTTDKNETTPVSAPAGMRVPTPVAAPTSSSSFVVALSGSISAVTLIIASMLFL